MNLAGGGGGGRRKIEEKWERTFFRNFDTAFPEVAAENTESLRIFYSFHFCVNASLVNCETILKQYFKHSILLRLLSQQTKRLDMSLLSINYSTHCLLCLLHIYIFQVTPISQNKIAAFSIVECRQQQCRWHRLHHTSHVITQRKHSKHILSNTKCLESGNIF